MVPLDDDTDLNHPIQINISGMPRKEEDGDGFYLTPQPWSAAIGEARELPIHCMFGNHPRFKAKKPTPNDLLTIHVSGTLSFIDYYESGGKQGEVEYFGVAINQIAFLGQAPLPNAAGKGSYEVILAC
jgi:hypothetical protein